MTTLCLCDFVEVAAYRERLSAPMPLPTPSARPAPVLVTVVIDPDLLPRVAVTYTTQEDLQ